MIDQILQLIGEITTPGFFVTAEFSREGTTPPLDMEEFILKKLKRIKEGSKGRKFVYQQGEWRIIFTFFPTDSVVEEKYALKNKTGLLSL